jgi:phospholipid/cholesterol/gamma-HCH transport system substrate-binding protein
MTDTRWAATKFTVFVIIMAVLTGFLYLAFSSARTGNTHDYSAVFSEVSDLRSGASVRVAGVRAGTVSSVTLETDKRVTVKFDVDDKIQLTSGTRVAVRYLNLVGDRYLELIDGPGSTRPLRPGSVIPMDRTSPALDLDLLLGGLKPVIRGLNARDVNALTASLLQIMQGQEGTLGSLLSNTSSLSSTLADNGQVVTQLIDNLKDTLATLSKDGDKFSATIDRLERLVSGLDQDRDQIGAAIEALDTGTASVADLLAQTRPPLAGTIRQVQRLATNLDQDKSKLGEALARAPENFRKVARTGAYGSWIQYYICDITVRVNDRYGRVAVLPTLKQNYGRCQ